MVSLRSAVVLVVILAAAVAPTLSAAAPDSLAPDAPTPKPKHRKGKSPIEHVVVLMEENRSFDHMLGFRNRVDPRVDGLTGTECQLRNTSDPSKGKVCVSDNALDKGVDDPCHGHSCTDEGIFGVPGPANMTGTPTMTGFVQNAIRIKHNESNPVQMWAPENVPIINTLADEFVLFDQWFCSHPGPTYPNRQFVHSATAHGETDDEVPTGGFPQETLYQRLNESGLDWKMYYEGHGGMAWAIFMSYLRTAEAQPNIVQMQEFYADAAAGTLPTYTFIEPRISTNTSAHTEKSFGLPNHQHPDASVREGERLMKNVYEALRNGPLWEKTLFIITYDEHGGFYDHVPPPQKGVPNPDGIDTVGGFDYTRLGVRIPTLLISPWVSKNVLVHDPPADVMPTPDSKWDLTSIPATILTMFDLLDPEAEDGGFLTKRDAWAPTFEYLLNETEPRTDCPTTLPDVPPPDLEAEYARQSALALNDHHVGVIGMLCDMNGRADDPTCGAGVDTQGEFTVWQKQQWDIFRSRFDVE